MACKRLITFSLDYGQLWRFNLVTLLGLVEWWEFHHEIFLLKWTHLMTLRRSSIVRAVQHVYGSDWKVQLQAIEKSSCDNSIMLTEHRSATKTQWPSLNESHCSWSLE